MKSTKRRITERQGTGEIEGECFNVNQMTTSHSTLIHLLGSQMDQVLSSIYPEPEAGCPYETKDNPTNEG
ncbi:hypothetical protein H5410_004735 [Solanum commersonii]|uniref:Uncharacterized protein n=1 Tax=Solanum commersonii TaxID=4109 RepID=A0A9J6A4N6_SOLCO|nr:hypothetical protein H5410_004735 [Solanum commersonii]